MTKIKTTKKKKTEWYEGLMLLIKTNNSHKAWDEKQDCQSSDSQPLLAKYSIMILEVFTCDFN